MAQRLEFVPAGSRRLEMMPIAPQPRRRPTRPQLQDAEDGYESTVLAFSRSRPRMTVPPREPRERDARSARRERPPSGTPTEAEPAPSERRLRRRKGRDAWLHRNALNLAAGSTVVAVLAVAFALAQFVTRGGASPQASPQATSAPRLDGNTTALTSASPVAGSLASQPTAVATREVRLSVRELQPNYSVEQGDSLVAIATRFNTSAARIQALNGLADPRVLNIGQKLVIPPPL